MNPNCVDCNRRLTNLDKERNKKNPSFYKMRCGSCHLNNPEIMKESTFSSEKNLETLQNLTNFSYQTGFYEGMNKVLTRLHTLVTELKIESLRIKPKK